MVGADYYEDVGHRSESDEACAHLRGDGGRASGDAKVTVDPGGQGGGGGGGGLGVTGGRGEVSRSRGEVGVDGAMGMGEREDGRAVVSFAVLVHQQRRGGGEGVVAISRGGVALLLEDLLLLLDEALLLLGVDQGVHSEEEGVEV